MGDLRIWVPDWNYITFIQGSRRERVRDSTTQFQLGAIAKLQRKHACNGGITAHSNVSDSVATLLIG